jgi:hypothetical protein
MTVFRDHFRAADLNIRICTIPPNAELLLYTSSFRLNLIHIDGNGQSKRWFLRPPFAMNVNSGRFPLQTRVEWYSSYAFQKYDTA